jgi:hypothetical protein
LLQVFGVDEHVLQKVQVQVRPGEAVAPGGRGYFKISSKHELREGLEGISEGELRSKKALVVAFGSAPGVPNWGGLLKRVELAGAGQPGWGSFDVLFVVDGSRSWYAGNCCIEAPYP